MQATLNAKFSQKTYIHELRREMKMRLKVWPTFKDKGETKFRDMSHQTCYDVLAELVDILENCNPAQFQAMAEKALSAKAITELPKADLYGYTENEQNCSGCMGPCGRCDEE